MIAQFEGKVALVTGAASGIGRATALAFARAGVKVIVSDVLAEGGQETVQIIKKGGYEGAFIKADVSKATEVETLVNTTIATYGRLDYAHNNAGVTSVAAPTAECTEENWDRVININLKGVWLCMKYEIPQMLKQGYGSIVNTASIFGLVGFTDRPPYVASKHGVVGLTKAAALEYAKLGIRVNAICPGTIRTPSMNRLIHEGVNVEADRIARHPIGRLGTPEEVAEAVVWLCSDAALFVTGHSMVIDGGFIAQ